jgi:hypothetical protein
MRNLNSGIVKLNCTGFWQCSYSQKPLQQRLNLRHARAAIGSGFQATTDFLMGFEAFFPDRGFDGKFPDIKTGANDGADIGLTYRWAAGQ